MKLFFIPPGVCVCVCVCVSLKMHFASLVCNGILFIILLFNSSKKLAAAHKLQDTTKDFFFSRKEVAVLEYIIIKFF